jgi:hypothetical protein
MELFNKALFLSQQKIFALTRRRVHTLRVNLFQILNQFVLLFRKNVIDKSSMIWRVLPLVKINTRISETPCIYLSYTGIFRIKISIRITKKIMCSYLKKTYFDSLALGLYLNLLGPFVAYSQSFNLV